MNITQALSQLDPKDDAHWTSDGLPRVDAVNTLLGAEVTRKDLTDAAPEFNRAAQQKLVDEREAKEAEEAAAAAHAPEPELTPAEERRAKIEGAVKSIAGCDDDVMSMPISEVLADIELCDRALAEMERQSEEVSVLRDAAQEFLVVLGKRSHMINKSRARLAKLQPKENPVHAYLARNRANREARARRVRSFTDSHGDLGRREVLDDLAGAPIDQAMARKQGRGRPQYPAPQTTQSTETS